MDNIPLKVFTKHELSSALYESREEKGGLTIEEIAEIITEHFDVSELRQLIEHLNGKIDNADTKRKPIADNFPENYDYPTSTDKALE